MFEYWTKPYPDEILYSILARHISYFGSSGPKQLLPYLFGKSTASSTIDLPSGLATLAMSTSHHKLGELELIQNHTLFPYYEKFISKDKRERIISSMLHSSGDIHTRCGINAGLFPAVKMPRYCPACFREDTERNSETYFRRSHQIPSMKICTTHNTFLKEHKRSAESINKHFFVKPQSVSEDKGFSRTNNNLSILSVGRKIISALGKDSDYHFNSNPYYYNQLIKQLGFRKGSDSLQIDSIYECFQEFNDHEMLLHYECPVSLEDENCWLKAILRKHRKGFDPIRHILIQDFIRGIKSKSKSKSGPKIPERYVCRNPICNRYNTDNGTRFRIQKDPKSKREITYIECDCGYSYTKSFISSKNIHFIRVKEFGPKWERELAKLIKSKKSIRSIGAILHTDSRTIKLKLERKRKDKCVNIIEQKEEWILLMKKFPSYSITELRRTSPSLYSFLYRHNKDWLIDQNYPVKNRAPSKRINWEERDSQLLIEIKLAYNQLKKEAPKRRISTSALLNLIGKESMFRVNKSHLPRLVAFFEKYSESPQQFRMRKIVMATNEMKNREERITYWKLLRVANIRKRYVDDKIHSIVQKIVNGSINSSIEVLQSA